MLKLDKVSKQYKDKKAVKEVSVCFERGVYGLLGENGAGKTTLMRMICGVLLPSGGQIYCDDRDIIKMGADYRMLLGYLPQDFGYYPDYTAWRFLMYIAALKALPEKFAKNRISELLELVNLTEVKDKKLKTFSGGMLKRVGIAQALLNDPKILVLDEPTSGLDPKERVRFRNIISALGKDRIILLSTHIVSDIEYISDEILIMKHGQLLISGKMEEIVSVAADKVWECTVSPEKAEKLNEFYTISNLRNVPEGVTVRLITDQAPAEKAWKAVPTLEDAYLYYSNYSQKQTL